MRWLNWIIGKSKAEEVNRARAEKECQGGYYAPNTPAIKGASEELNKICEILGHEVIGDEDFGTIICHVFNAKILFDKSFRFYSFGNSVKTDDEVFAYIKKCEKSEADVDRRDK